MGGECGTREIHISFDGESKGNNIIMDGVDRTQLPQDKMH
jgi:hypothetical protein